MTSTSARPANPKKPPRDPNTAAFLSLLPGLGQIYNGETRKGYLFLGVSFLNFCLLMLLVFTNDILRGLCDFGKSFHMVPNRELVFSIQQIHLGSPPSLVLIGLFFAFIAFSVRDAYDHASLIQRRHIYPEYVMQMTEAAAAPISSTSAQWFPPSSLLSSS